MFFHQNDLVSLFLIDMPQKFINICQSFIIKDNYMKVWKVLGTNHKIPQNFKKQRLSKLRKIRNKNYQKLEKK